MQANMRVTRMDDSTDLAAMARGVGDKRRLRERYRQKDYRVRVHVIRCKNLPASDFLGTCDPYLVFALGNEDTDGMLLCNAVLLH